MRRAAAAAIALVLVVVVSVTGGETDTEAANPGTNGRIAITNFTNNDTEVWTMNPDGSDRQQVTQSAEFVNGQPAFSPDGNTILFFRNTGDEDTRGLYTVNSSGGAVHLIPNTPDDAALGSWSPDGTQIVFERVFPSRIFKINLDGTGEVNLTPAGTSGGEAPAWSPLGNKIAYIGYPLGGGVDIFVMDPDGSNKTNVTNTPDVVEGNPDWSPSGQKIIFDVESPAAASEGFGDAPARNIAVINANGTGFELITNDSVGDQSDPVFSPDGAKIAYVESPERGLIAFGVNQVVVANADGTNPQDISPPSPDDVSPSWGVDEPLETPDLLWGDTDCSGMIDEFDALLVLLYAAGLGADTFPCQGIGAFVSTDVGLVAWGDVNCDGFIDELDAILMLAYVADLEDSEPIPPCPQFRTTVGG
jgi:Tol biopolymer transport system component